MIRPLIADIQEVARRIKVETTRIVTTGPLLANILQGSVLQDPEDPDTVMQPVPDINVTPIV